MAKTVSVLLILLLTGCASVPHPQYTASPCAAQEASYECQVERYHNVSGN
jgi:uncharacterized lipoprotein YmbA